MEDKIKTSDYSQGKIYKIVCNKTGLVYIGSTCRSLDERLKEHEYDSKRYLEKKTNIFNQFSALIINKINNNNLYNFYMNIKRFST